MSLTLNMLVSQPKYRSKPKDILDTELFTPLQHGKYRFVVFKIIYNAVDAMRCHLILRNGAGFGPITHWS